MERIVSLLKYFDKKGYLMAKRDNGDFGSEMAEILPGIMRAFARSKEELCSRRNLAISHIVVLDLLTERKTCRMSEIAGTLGFTMSAATAIVDKMVRSGLLMRKRADDDRRVVRVELKKKGEDTARLVKEWRKESTGKLYSVLTEKEKLEFTRIMTKVADNIKEAK